MPRIETRHAVSRLLALLALTYGAMGVGSAEPAMAHGIHDVRGRVRLESGSLNVVIDAESAPDGSEFCLRLLDQLHVRDFSGARLVGILRREAGPGRCGLIFPLAPQVRTLTLQIRTTHRDARAERIVLRTIREGVAGGRTVVLTPVGNVETLTVAP